MSLFFFFQAEDGIRDYKVTGVQTCALPISLEPRRPRGCLVTNSAAELASRDRATATRVGVVLAKIEAAFHRAVVRAQTAGEIDRARDPRALARFLTSSAQ